MSTAKFLNWRLEPDLIPRAPTTFVRADVVEEGSRSERLSASAVLTQFVERVQAQGLVPIAAATVSPDDDPRPGSVLEAESRYTAQVQVQTPSEDFHWALR